MNDVLETGTQQTTSLVVDMVSDLICPWCFVAKRRVEKAAAILGEKVEMHWLPFELNADMPVDGLDRRVYRKRSSNPPSQGAEPVLKCGYGSSDERSHGKTTDAGRDSADCGGVCNERHATE